MLPAIPTHHIPQVLDLNECSKITNEVFLWLIEAKQQGADVMLQRMTIVWNSGPCLLSSLLPTFVG